MFSTTVMAAVNIKRPPTWMNFQDGGRFENRRADRI